MKQRTVKV